MKRLILISIVALALPAAALAKGPSAAEISGPGIGTISLSGDAEGGAVTSFSTLTETAGFFAAVYRPEPDPMLRVRPKSNLGPRYRIAWTLPTPAGKSTLFQDVYPYAKPYALTYMRPGQTFYDGMTTNGGWYVGAAALKQALVDAGLPAHPSTGDGSGLSSGALAGIAVAGAVALALLVAATRIRRRPRAAVAG
jgi:hypothetical protein